jgi:hypothetical protein
LFLLLLHRVDWSHRRKIGLGLVAVASGYALGFVAGPVFDRVPPAVETAVEKLGPTALFAALWWLARPGLWRTTTSLMVACGLSNVLGLLIPPHEVIDFMYSKWISTVFHLGVFNVADLYFCIGIVCFAVLVARTFLRRLGISV